MADPSTPTPEHGDPRSAARLAAVQALYQMELTGVSLEDVLTEFADHRFGHEIDGAAYIEADGELFRSVVSGVVNAQDAIDEAIAVSITQGWTLKRVERILRAILRAGTHELMASTDVPVKVIINEYMDIAHAFFAENEPSFVNGVLDSIARHSRKNLVS